MPNDRTITEDDLVENLEQRIIEASGVRTLEEAARYRFTSSDAVRGLNVVQKEGAFDLSFINGEQFTDGGRIYATTINATYGMAIEDVGERLRLVVSTPSEYVIERGRSPIGTEYSPLFSNERAETEIERINNGLEPVFTFTEQVEGEAQSPWQPESVEANFERTLATDSGSGDYVLRVDGKTVSLDIEVFAYRDGSMVEYEFPYSFQAKGDGSVNLSQSEIDALIDRIEEIATN